ncbi:MAG: hypothetical protein ABIG42_03000 [bacterium]
MRILQLENCILLVIAFGAVFAASIYIQERIVSFKNSVTARKHPARIDSVKLIDWLIIIITMSLLVYLLR